MRWRLRERQANQTQAVAHQVVQVVVARQVAQTVQAAVHQITQAAVHRTTRAAVHQIVQAAAHQAVQIVAHQAVQIAHHLFLLELQVQQLRIMLVSLLEDHMYGVVQVLQTEQIVLDLQ